MDFSSNSDKFLEYFFDYLSRSGVSDSSFKYYRSDISHFSGWMILKVRTWGIFADSILEVVPFIKTGLIAEYRDFLTKNDISPKTINRRLSSLRHLSRFLILSQISDSDFMEGISNVSLSISKKSFLIHPLLPQFQKELENQKVSKNTIKGYLSDIRHFLTWIETKQHSNISNS